MKKTFMMTLAAAAIFAVACEKDEINSLNNDLNALSAQSQAADDALAGDLNKLEGDLDAFKQLVAEVNAAQDEITRLNDEASLARDEANQLAIDANAAEIIRVNDVLSAAITELTSELSAQISRVDSVISSNFDALTTAIEAESAAREAGDQLLASAIELEIEERKSQASDLLSSVSANAQAISKVAKDLASEIENRISADAALKVELEKAIADGDDALRTELEAAIKVNSDNIASAQSQLTQVKQDIGVIEITIVGLQNQINDNSNDLGDLDEAVKAAAAVAAQAVQDAADAQADADKAQEAAEAAQQAADTNASAIATLETNVAAVNVAISALSSDTLDLSSIQESIDDAIAAAIDALPADEIFDDSAIIESIENLEAAYKAADVLLQAGIDGIEEYNDAELKAQIEAVKSSIAALQAEVDLIPSDDDSALQDLIDGLQDSLDALDTKVEAIEIPDGGLSEAAIQALINAAIADIDETDLSSLEAAIEALEVSVEAIPSDDDSDNTEAIAALQAEIAKLKVSISELSGEDYYTYSDWGPELGIKVSDFVQTRTSSLTTIGATDVEAPIEEALSRDIVVSASDAVESQVTIDDVLYNRSAVTYTTTPDIGSHTVNTDTEAVTEVVVTKGTLTQSGKFTELELDIDVNEDGDKLDSGDFTTTYITTLHDNVEQISLRELVGTEYNVISNPSPEIIVPVVSIADASLYVGEKFEITKDSGTWFFKDNEEAWEEKTSWGNEKSITVTNGHIGTVYFKSVLDGVDSEILTVTVSADSADTWTYVVPTETQGGDNSDPYDSTKAPTDNSVEVLAANISNTSSATFVTVISQEQLYDVSAIDTKEVYTVNGILDSGSTFADGDTRWTETTAPKTGLVHAEPRTYAGTVVNPNYDDGSDAHVFGTDEVNVVTTSLGAYGGNYTILASDTVTELGTVTESGNSIIGKSFNFVFAAEGTYYVSYYSSLYHLVNDTSNPNFASIVVDANGDAVVTKI